MKLLRTFDAEGKYLTDQLEKIPLASSSNEDRRLAMEIALGVLRRRPSLHALLAPLSRRPIDKLDTAVRIALEIGAYQLLVLTRIPAHAAVNESVALVNAKTRGLVNALLRRLSERLEVATETSTAPDDLSKSVFADTDRYLTLQDEIIPVNSFPSVIAASCWGLPKNIGELLKDSLSTEQLYQVAIASATRPSLTIRSNPRRVTPEAAREEMQKQFVKILDEPEAGIFRVESPDAPQKLVIIKRGAASVQDITAARVSLFAAPIAGDKVLDICAAPGGKATHLAEIMNDEGTVVAVDSSEFRMGRVRENINRLRLKAIECFIGDGTTLPEPKAPFDLVLVDAPCSNLGVLGRRTEAKYRFEKKGVEELIELQSKLLVRSLEVVRRGGSVIYSTCTLNPAENLGVVANAMQKLGTEYILEDEKTTLPMQGKHDGGYCARITRAR